MPLYASDGRAPLRDLVQRKRHELALSMSDLADKAGITRSHLYSLLDGSTRDPSVHTLSRLSAALHVSPIVLLRHYLHGPRPADLWESPAAVVRSQTVPGDSVSVMAQTPTPEASLMAPGETFTQVWTLQNAGTVAWQMRSLVRLDETLVIARRVGSQLEAVLDAHLRCPVDRLPIPDTPPGQPVTLRLDFTAPDRGGTFASVWHMRDAQGLVSFPQDFLLQTLATVVQL